MEIFNIEETKKGCKVTFGTEDTNFILFLSAENLRQISNFAQKEKEPIDLYGLDPQELSRLITNHAYSKHYGINKKVKEENFKPLVKYLKRNVKHSKEGKVLVYPR